MRKPTAPSFRPLSTFCCCCWRLRGCWSIWAAVCEYGGEREKAREREKTVGGESNCAYRTSVITAARTQRRMSRTWDLPDKNLAGATERNHIMYLLHAWKSVKDRLQHTVTDFNVRKCRGKTKTPRDTKAGISDLNCLLMFICLQQVDRQATVWCPLGDKQPACPVSAESTNSCRLRPCMV